MYRVRVKRFADTEQIQVYEKVGRREAKDDFLEHDYLYTTKKPKNASLIENPFNDDKSEWVTKVTEPDKEDSIRISRSRTINKIYDIARSNTWDWFFTLTFNPDKVDSLNYTVVVKKLSDWLKNMRKKCPDMKYIVVPEQHKSGRWHFHGLFADVNEMDFIDSGRVSESGKVVYNVGNYKLGWSTATKIEDNHRASSYMCKYITKDLCRLTQNKKRYWASRNVNLPDVIDYDVNMTYEDIMKCIDLENGHAKSVEGFINVSYVDVPIYSTNTCSFVENDISACLPD